MNLYEIDFELSLCMQEAEQEALESEGEISEFLGNRLDNLNQEKSKKIGNICRYIKSLQAEANMVKVEAKNLIERGRVAENKANWLKNYLSSCMDEGEKFADENSKISWRKSESVIIEDLPFDSAPEDWLRWTADWNKAVIKKDIKNGVEINGVKLVTKQNIQIK